jgi:hypothetical protein
MRDDHGHRRTEQKPVEARPGRAAGSVLSMTGCKLQVVSRKHAGGLNLRQVP